MNFKVATLGTLILSASLVSVSSSANQMMGASVESIHTSGYGLYVVRMKPSPEAGTISSFFLYGGVKPEMWPKNWSEIDLEFTPGFHTAGEKGRYLLSANQADNCFDPAGQYSKDFYTAHCKIDYPATSGKEIAIHGNKNWAMSFNTYGNTPLVMGQNQSKNTIIQAPSNQQVFYQPRDVSGNPIDPSSRYYDYYIWYTPTGIYWSAPVAETFPRAAVKPSALNTPIPVFAKLWNSNTTAEGGQAIPSPQFAAPADLQSTTYDLQRKAMGYHSDQFTPMDNSDPASPKIIAGGRQMKMMFNLWDGSLAKGATGQPWGGPTPPTARTSSGYQNIAFYPLTIDLSTVKLGSHPDPRIYSYGAASQYSDFTGNGSFMYNGNKVSFNQLWALNDGDAGFPVGIASVLDVFANAQYPPVSGSPAEYQKGSALYLAMRGYDDWATPNDHAPPGQNNTHSNCAWADVRGIE